MQHAEVLILGAGAAGLMAAIHSARRGRRTLVLDHADRPGKKILISGGGRCNFTNLHARPENFLSANPHFAKSALARYTPQDFIALVEKHRIPYHEKTLGQLFCDRSAHDILNLLLRECAEANAQIQLATTILSVTTLSSRSALSSSPSANLSSRSAAEGSASLPPRFHIETSQGPITTQSLVIATGGLSIPRMGATAFGYDLARQFTLEVIEPRPALVPLVFNPEDAANWCDLTGLSAEVIASIPAAPLSGTATAKPKTVRSTFREKLLITHRGLSGPAILQISSYWRPGQPIEIDLAPGRNITAPLLAPKGRRDPSALSLSLRTALAQRLADRWLRLHLPTILDRDLNNTALAHFERNLHAWTVTPAGTEGYAKAEVTAGGVSTAELDSTTMQSKKVPGLYFIGEVVDVTGWLGGYNFQWAWASGHAAGHHA